MNDISRLQYKIDLSALDPEGFKVDFSYLSINDNSYNVRLSSDKLYITTPGARDPSTNDLSLVIWPQDGGTLPDGSYSDISKTYYSIHFYTSSLSLHLQIAMLLEERVRHILNV